MLAAAVAKSGDVAAVQRAIDVIADASQPEWQRTALLKGLDAGLPALGAPAAGGRGGRWRWRRPARAECARRPRGRDARSRRLAARPSLPR